MEINLEKGNKNPFEKVILKKNDGTEVEGTYVTFLVRRHFEELKKRRRKLKKRK